MSISAIQPSEVIRKYETWDEDTTPFRHILRLDAATYRPDTIFDTAPSFWAEHGSYEVSPQGNFAYHNRVVPKGTSLRLFGKQEGKVVWDGDVIVPTLIDMKRHCGTGERFLPDCPEEFRATYGAIWMSLTPMEMITQRSAVKRASHTVVIGGLGLGWLLRKVCEKPEVMKVIVVEKSKELLDWFGEEMCARFEKVAEVICDDVYRQVGKHGLEARYLLDIWHLFSGAANDDRLPPLRHKLKKRLWAWGLD